VPTEFPTEVVFGVTTIVVLAVFVVARIGRSATTLPRLDSEAPQGQTASHATATVDTSGRVLDRAAYGEIIQVLLEVVALLPGKDDFDASRLDHLESPDLDCLLKGLMTLTSRLPSTIPVYSQLERFSKHIAHFRTERDLSRIGHSIDSDFERLDLERKRIQTNLAGGLYG